MLLVWFGNSLPTLIAMTLPVEYCQMSCCKTLDHSSEKSCPAMSDPTMSEMSDSHEAMEGMKEMTENQIPEDAYKDILFVAQPDDDERFDISVEHALV